MPWTVFKMELCQVDFRLVGASTARAVWRHLCPQCKKSSRVTMTRARAQLTSSGHLELNTWVVCRQYRGVKVKSIQLTRHINGTGTLD